MEERGVASGESPLNRGELSRLCRNRKDDENKVTLKVNEVLYLDSSGVDLRRCEGGWDNVHQSEGGEFSGDVAASRWAGLVFYFVRRLRAFLSEVKP
ncbi:hypothetical protein K0M31_000478 [Melipona bicolor]|uniref:Uncharacterized protein n=1 Tax=Melipona bicolor TaxID=60889 RepID=A0AA40KWS1_9HYME|nr:hypothetical protein K0M31_000478 [Melipona bicolor]